MRIPRIYLNQPMSADAVIQLDERSAHYLANVLRFREGAELVLFNGSDHEFLGNVERLSRKSGSVLIKEVRTVDSESTLHTHLGIGLSRGERMDYAVQKSTELGVNIIQPLYTEFCEVKLDKKRELKKLEHWRHVSISACEQCGRIRPPEIREPVSLQGWLESSLECDKKFLLDQQQESVLQDAIHPASVALLIGPEGGLSDKEKALALSQGFDGLKLGARTFRTETAPVAALSLFQFLWGN